LATFAFGGVAVFLAFTSAAYACTVFRGRLTVTASGGGTATAVGNPSSGMAWCAGTFSDTAQAPTTGGSVTVQVAPVDCAGNAAGSGTLPSSAVAGNNYDVNFSNYQTVKGKSISAYTVSGGVYTRKLDCMTGDTRTGPQFVLGTLGTGLVVDATGSSAVQTYALPSGLTANTTSDASGICVTTPPSYTGGTRTGNQLPIAII